MSYLDFSIYTQRVYSLYEQDEERKAKEKQAKAEAMNANFENLANAMIPSF